MYKYALTFIGGLVAGLIVAKVVTKMKDKEFDEPEDAVESDVNGYTEVEESADDYREEMEMSRENEDYTSYTNAYVDSSKKEHPEDDDPEDVDYVEEPEANAEMKKYKKPRLIKESEFGEMAGFDTQMLKYFVYDDKLVTEENEELKDQELYVGDCLTKYGFKDNEEQEVFIRNSKLTTDYNVVKVLAAFSEWES